MKRIFGVFIFFLFTMSCCALAEQAVVAPPASTPTYPPAVGEIYGAPVLKSDFDFVLKTFSIFNTSAEIPDSDDKKRAETWKHLIFLKEAKERNVQLPQEKFKEEMGRLLSEKNITYGSLAYHEMIQTNFGEDSATFEKRLKDLLIVKAMLDDILHPPPPDIKEEEAKQKFLNQYNSMLVEFVKFPTLEEANAFYKKMTKKKWDQEKKNDPKFSTPTGHISLEAIIDLWKVPTADAYRIHDMSLGSIAAPAPMYKGYGVMRLIEKKDSDLKDYTDKKKTELMKTLEQVYYYDHTQKVIQDMFTKAALRDYERDKVMILETSQGSAEFTLYPTVAPKACENFVKLAEKGYYNGLLFHRVIKNFMIQGGDPTGTGTGGESIWGKPFEDEVNDNIQFDHAGILAMANSGPNTNGSQFFITVAAQPQLYKKHTIFGEVSSGYEIIKKISEVEVNENDRPKQDQKIIHLSLKKWPTSLPIL